ncbi:MAG: Hsp70 family protein [Planctomycetota bacterium]|nr:MAG: Hsp70 family protein [Planctomycetota bacterium]
MSNEANVIIGIDLGTTNSLVAFCDEKGPRILSNESIEGQIPSVLAFDPEKGVTIGREAKVHAVEKPETTVFSIKRLMVRGYDELAKSGELEHLPYHVVKRVAESSDRDIAAVEIEDRLMTPPELSAIILRELKQRAEAVLGCQIGKAVITVPAYFDDAQRQATRDAGKIAGLEVMRIINEPTAAALAYGLGVRDQTELSQDEEIELPLAQQCNSLDDQEKESSTNSGSTDDEPIIAVYDLGGGTFDISILRIVNNVFEVLSTHGNTQLGGDDLDREIIKLIQREIKEQFRINIESPQTKQALRTFAENVKIRLSTEQQASVEIDIGQGRLYKRTISRNEFEAMIAPWIDKTMDSCRRALTDARIEAETISQVIMVGGSTRIPYVRQRAEGLFGRRPYTALNPEEVVALGAAVQAGVLARTRSDALLLVIIPLSLGIETMGGAMGKLILRNTRIPCQAAEFFSTFVDGQTNVKINVLQGERELAKDCRSLGEFELRDIPPMPAGIPKIRVSFLIDENGILNVSAIEERSAKQASIQIIPTHGLTVDEVKRMEIESIMHARKDMTEHWLIDLRNQITFDTNKAEQMLAKVGDRMNARQRGDIEHALHNLRMLAEKSDSAELLQRALGEFNEMTVRLAELSITQSLQQAGDSDLSSSNGV